MTHTRVSTGLPNAFIQIQAGKQNTDSKTPYFSLEDVPLINLHEVMRYYMIGMQIRLMSAIRHILDM